MSSGGPVPVSVAGRYRLAACISRGAVTQRWEATDTVLARQVVVERLDDRFRGDPDAVRTFAEAAASLARVAHPALAAVYDTGADADGPYAVTSLPRGLPAASLLDRAGPLPPVRVVTIGDQLAGVLAAAHRRGIVHGSIGPGCVIVDDDDHVTVDGWVGAAANTTNGTRHEPDEDVAAAGALLYLLLCGHPPDPVPTAPRRARSGIPADLSDAVMEALPGGSIVTAEALGRALAAVDLGPDDARPDVVREPTPAAGVRPIARAHRRSRLGPLSAALVVAIGLAAALLAVSGANGPAGRNQGTGSGAAGSPVTLAAVSSFDPSKGAGNVNQENPQMLRFAHDGDPATVWSTQEYASRKFGNIKSGVGLFVTLDHARSLRTLTIQSPSTGWSGQVYVATAAGAPGAPGNSLGDWGQPVATFTTTAPTTDVNLHGSRGGAVLLWVTDLGPPNPKATIFPFRVDIAELDVRA